MTAVRMFQFQMHTGFLDADTTCFQLERCAVLYLLHVHVRVAIKATCIQCTDIKKIFSVDNNFNTFALQKCSDFHQEYALVFTSGSGVPLDY